MQAVARAVVALHMGAWSGMGYFKLRCRSEGRFDLLTILLFQGVDSRVQKDSS